MYFILFLYLCTFKTFASEGVHKIENKFLKNLGAKLEHLDKDFYGKWKVEKISFHPHAAIGISSKSEETLKKFEFHLSKEKVIYQNIECKNPQFVRERKDMSYYSHLYRR